MNDGGASLTSRCMRVGKHFLLSRSVDITAVRAGVGSWRPASPGFAGVHVPAEAPDYHVYAFCVGVEWSFLP